MAEPIELSALAAAIGLGAHELVTIVGGGGKTTTLFSLGAQLRGTRVLTTTTKMGRDRTDGFRALFGPTDDEVRAAIGAEGGVLAWHADGGHKAIGVTPQRCDQWFDLADHVIVEADGAARHPFKAPRPFEPGGAEPHDDGDRLHRRRGAGAGDRRSVSSAAPGGSGGGLQPLRAPHAGAGRPGRARSPWIPQGLPAGRPVRGGDPQGRRLVGGDGGGARRPDR